MVKIFARAIACTLVMCAWCAAQAAPVPPREPVLRIETGAHLSIITRITADAAGKWLVTASEDKTARVWDAHSGVQVAVLRPPIGAESLGALYAAAISPDGRTIATGGNSAFDGAVHILHLFDRASATVPASSTLAGLEAPITQLAWSRDNAMIAVGLRQQGLRVFRRNLQFVGSDPEFNEAIFGADFAPDGRLAAVALDGYLRVYATGKEGLERKARKQLAGGKPYSVAFSPDGKTLAVGYQDVARIDLLDATTLDLVKTIERGNGNLGRVTWAADGQTLYAAGTFVSNGRFALLAFDTAGRGNGREIGAFSNTVMSLAALPDGAVAAASAEPGWQIIDRQLKARVGVHPQSADFRDSQEKFALSSSADNVAFRFSPEAGDLVFDLVLGSVKPGSAPPSSVLPRIPAALTDWKNSAAPQLNRKPLTLRSGEISRSAAVTVADKSVVIGTEWFVRHFAMDGKELWATRVPATAWAVNVSGDGKWLVAALGDGSLRWYRLSDGKEQLAVFVHADKSRWIAWTPQGYYDTSVGGENLVGWHLNRAFNQSADFFSAGRFRERLYRPDVIQKLLATGDEAEAVAKADALARAETAAKSVPLPPPVVATAKTTGKVEKPVTTLATSKDITEVLPPIVELHSEPFVETGATTVPVRFEVRSPGDAPVSGIKARVNGRLVRNLAGKGLRAIGVQEIEVPIPPGDAEIMVFAENKYGKSDPVSIKVARAAERKPATQVEKYEKLYLLVVGISKYPEPWTLGLSSKDAQDFAINMAQQRGKLYKDAEQRVLIDGDATRQNVLDGLKWLTEKVGERDAGMVFFAGHGDNVGQNYFFIPGDANAFPAKGETKSTAEFDAWKKKNGPSVWVPGEEIAKTLLNLKGRTAFFVDTCHSGNLARQANRASGDMTGALNSLDDEKGVIIFASSTSRELSQEDDSWGNGAFTKAIIEGLKGGADKDKTGLIRPTYLSAFVNDRVRALTNNEQRPVIFTVGIDDPIASKTK